MWCVARVTCLVYVIIESGVTLYTHVHSQCSIEQHSHWKSLTKCDAFGFTVGLLTRLRTDAQALCLLALF